MKCIYSLWTAPLRKQKDFSAGFRCEQDHKNSWRVAVTLARKHFSEVELITDNEGYIWMMEQDLPFTNITLALDELSKDYADFWMLGKIRAYAMQNKPFIHSDADVFFWDKPSDKLLGSDLFAQSPEMVDDVENDYLPWGYFPKRVSMLEDLPANWDTRLKEVANVGIVGGSRIDVFKTLWESMQMILGSQKNRETFRQFFKSGNHHYIQPLLEQYHLSLIAKNKQVNFSYLFDKAEGEGSPFDKDESKKLNYTHLLAGSKKDFALLQALSKCAKNI